MEKRSSWSCEKYFLIRLEKCYGELKAVIFVRKALGMAHSSAGGALLVPNHDVLL